ncbi:isoprenylcysteine carboxyl methyltransferase [Nocardia nova]|uniref:methyltransferase family protein n=1 Tax=Nocardia nova TaxID=37330 RepID=UPI000CEA10B9|nr:isoprenylcysteine carboxylmethyltransferase family protein [Nocardia nova]PPJ08719.1 isoprenylcysteine carboxyl methyltransferase [Nocardia nova]
MSERHAAVGTLVFFAVAPGTVAGLIPWWISRWEFHHTWLPAQIVGAVVIGVGLIPLIGAFIEFARSAGTPAPIAPTETLVVSGFNRYVRNPMYLGVVMIIAGQSLFFGQIALLLYAALIWAVTALFVVTYEQPTLTARYGEQYENYRAAVPAWVPRLHPSGSRGGGCDGPSV